MFIFWSLLFTELAALHKCTVISPSLFYALAPKRNCTVRLARDTFSAKPRMLILPDDFLIVFACLLITDYLTGCKHNENWTGLQGNFIHIFTSLLFFFFTVQRPFLNTLSTAMHIYTQCSSNTFFCSKGTDPVACPLVQTRPRAPCPAKCLNQPSFPWNALQIQQSTKRSLQKAALLNTSS